MNLGAKNGPVGWNELKFSIILEVGTVLMH